MAALPDSIPVPPFPRWTGVRARLAPARAARPGYLAVIVTAPTITRRARLWLAWHHLTKGADDRAPSDN